MREYSDAIKLPLPPPMVGGGYRISNFLMAKGVKKEVNKEVKKKLQHQCPTIKYYENTKYALNRKVTKKIPHNCHVKWWIFFPAQLKCAANGISVQNVNVLPILWSHF